MESLLYNKPFKLSENRIAYLIKGGSLIDRFYGHEPRKDCLESQAWIASTVQTALGNKQEGLSRLTPEYGGFVFRDLLKESASELLGDEHVKFWGENTGILVKLLHSDDRLLVQTHPNKQKAMQYFHSPFGKTEAWYVLDVTEGKKAVVYAGFKPNVTREYFKGLIEKQDTNAILNCLHCFEVKKGDVMFIQAGLPHALGSDSLVVEIQEPTDITLRAERFRPDGSELPPESLHSGIGMEGLLDCFSFDGGSAEKIRESIFIKPMLVHLDELISEYQLIGYEDTPCFSMNSIEIKQVARYYKTNNSFAVALVLDGEGEIESGKYRMELRKGEELFIPHGVTEYSYHTENKLHILECYPPKV